MTNDPGILEDFRPFSHTKYWMIRQAIVETLEILVNRQVLPPAAVAGFMDEILITSNGFQPLFPLKVELRRLARTLEQSLEQHEIPGGSDKKGLLSPASDRLAGSDKKDSPTSEDDA